MENRQCRSIKLCQCIDTTQVYSWNAWREVYLCMQPIVNQLHSEVHVFYEWFSGIYHHFCYVLHKLSGVCFWIIKLRPHYPLKIDFFYNDTSQLWKITTQIQFNETLLLTCIQIHAHREILKQKLLKCSSFHKTLT